ncbi:MAG: hypothetical protein K6D94_05625 [Clostridiales bacterium]|nr:hypothetical protein [Clostridiales bacterium]
MSKLEIGYRIAVCAGLLSVFILMTSGCDTAWEFAKAGYRIMTGKNAETSTAGSAQTSDTTSIEAETAAPETETESAETEPETKDEIDDTEPAGLIVLDMITGLYSDPNNGFGGDETVTDYTEIRHICDLVISETNNMFDYYAEEIYFDDPDTLFRPYTADYAIMGIPVTVKRFSGFSMAGKYWDEPEKYTLFIADDRLFFKSADGGSDFIRTRDPEAERYHSFDSMMAAYDSYYNAGDISDPSLLRPAELCGEWVRGFDGGYSYLSLESSGSYTFMQKINGVPAKAFVGVWGASDGLITVLSEQLGWGGQPYDGSMTYDIGEDGKLILSETELYTSFVIENTAEFFPK